MTREEFENLKVGDVIYGGLHEEAQVVHQVKKITTVIYGVTNLIITKSKNGICRTCEICFLDADEYIKVNDKPKKLYKPWG